MRWTTATNASWAPTLLAGVLALAACSEKRHDPIFTDCPTWETELADAFTQQCVSCHSGEAAAGSYDLTTYIGALGNGTDQIPNAIEGDASSRLLTALSPAAADQTHAPFSDLHPRLSSWVSQCRLAYDDNPLHEAGIMNPSAGDFHGALVREFLYDFSVCASCHGEDFSGGSSESACTTCHQDGPTACDTCHTPSSGAHAVHLRGGALGKTFACSTCHLVPDDVLSPGHVLTASGALDQAPAEVELSGLGAGGSWDPESRSCAGVYCHSPNPADSSAAVPAPIWNGAGRQAECGACHGQPPSTHADDRCDSCHPRVITRDGTLLAALHLDGEATIGKTGSGCNDCHGGSSDGAPPPDLAGNTHFLEVTVGAHASHLLVPSGLRGPLGCDDCHAMPTELSSAGHIDSAGPAEVFPSGFTGLATAGGATPVWDRVAQTCDDNYCHQSATPVWTNVGAREAQCGTCHVLPPTSMVHNSVLSINDCANCHSSVLDSSGNIIITGGVSKHIDGDIDF